MKADPFSILCALLSAIVAYGIRSLCRIVFRLLCLIFFIARKIEIEEAYREKIMEFYLTFFQYFHSMTQ